MQMRDLMLFLAAASATPSIMQMLQKYKSNFYSAFLKYNEATDRYSLQNSGYSDFFDWLKGRIDYIFKLAAFDYSQNKYSFYISKPKGDRTYLEQIFISLGLIESMGIALYETNGGDNPQIYIRINSKMQLERVVNDPDRYDNQILKNVKDRHKTSVNMLKYLFENQVSSEKFWDLIEDYFLGHIPYEVEHNV
jgi:ATP-dependent DNA helicase RecQ